MFSQAVSLYFCNFSVPVLWVEEEEVQEGRMGKGGRGGGGSSGGGVKA